jgi:chaperonin GroES
MQTLKTTVEDLKVEIDKAIAAHHDRVIIKRDTPQQFTTSGFEIPGSFIHKHKPNTGIVLSVGKRCKEARAFQYVLFGKNSGTELTVNDSTVLVMREADLILDINTKLPFADKVLIKPVEAPKMVKGIHIPDNAAEQPQTGCIVSVGPQCDETKEGENVLFGKFAGLHVMVSGEPMLVIRESDVFAHLDEKG